MTKRFRSSDTTERIDHQIAEAVQADRQFLLEHAAVLSVKDTRKRLAGMLGVDPAQLKTPGAKAALDSALRPIVSMYWDTEVPIPRPSSMHSLFVCAEVEFHSDSAASANGQGKRQTKPGHGSAL